MAVMERVLLTMTPEQRRKLKVLAGKNSSGWMQLVIDKLYEAKERQDAIKPVQQQSLRAVGSE